MVVDSENLKGIQLIKSPLKLFIPTKNDSSENNSHNASD